jgi:hypothetical protein
MSCRLEELIYKFMYGIKQFIMTLRQDIGDKIVGFTVHVFIQ